MLFSAMKLKIEIKPNPENNIFKKTFSKWILILSNIFIQSIFGSQFKTKLNLARSTQSFLCWAKPTYTWKKLSIKGVNR